MFIVFACTTGYVSWFVCEVHHSTRGGKRGVPRKVSMSVKPQGAVLLQTHLRNLVTHSSRSSCSAFEDDQHACPGGMELTYTLGRTERARCRRTPWWMDDQNIWEMEWHYVFFDDFSCDICSNPYYLWMLLCTLHMCIIKSKSNQSLFMTINKWYNQNCF